MSLVCPSCAVRLACRYRCVRVPARRCRQSDRYGGPGDGTALCRRPRRVGGTAMSLVCPSCAVRLACRYRCVRVPTRRPPPRSPARQTGRATGARARHKTRNTTDIRESCARLGVSRPTENGAFRCFKKAAPFSVARGAIFHNLLKRQKIAPVLTRRARAAQSGIGCVARLNRIYRCSTACLAGTRGLAPHARTESRAARG
jgi:hypothetical protein